MCLCSDPNVCICFVYVHVIVYVHVSLCSDPTTVSVSTVPDTESELYMLLAYDSLLALFGNTQL